MTGPEYSSDDSGDGPPVDDADLDELSRRVASDDVRVSAIGQEAAFEALSDRPSPTALHVMDDGQTGHRGCRRTAGHGGHSLYFVRADAAIPEEPGPRGTHRRRAVEKGLRGDMCGADMCGATRCSKSTRPGLALDFAPWDKQAGEGPRTRPRKRAPRLRNEWRRPRRHPPAHRRRGECARLGHVLGELQVLLPDRRRTTNASPGPGENYEALSRRLTENSI